MSGSDLAGPIVARLAGGHHEEVATPLVKAWPATQGQPVIGPAAAHRRAYATSRVRRLRRTRGHARYVALRL
jgi:hypothetical protein